MKPIMSTLIIIALAVPALSAGKEYRWKYGKKASRVTVIEGMVIEFSPGENRSFNGPRKGMALMDRPSSKTYRIYSVTDASAAAAIRSGKMPAGYGDNYTLLFRDQSGRTKALPGGVIVYFKKSLGSAAVEQWASDRGLAIVRKISSYHNSYLVRSAPGVASLELSNSLNSADRVVKASPNWWARPGKR